MRDELHTFATILWPPMHRVRLAHVTVEKTSIRLQFTAIAPAAARPRCGIPSSAIHSRYQHRLTDLPQGTRTVHLQLTVRKFLCRNATRTRRIFTERLPTLVAPFARKTNRLITVLQATSIALGGRAGARLAARLRLPISAATLPRLARVAPVPHTPALQAIGGDEWPWRRGHRHGTILVDLASHRATDLLPERSVATVTAWLALDPTIAVVCRHRSPLHADGIRQGAPDAAQVVDRFHLVNNLREVEQLCRLDARVAWANQLTQAFLAVAREHRGHALEAWMAEATHSGIDELARFARGLQEDLAAVTAGLPLTWSHGVTEGHVHRLQLVKRQGYGRAGFALLRQRVLQVA